MFSDQTYSELLKDPRWHEKRREVMERDWYMCQECGCCDDYKMQVHHKRYEYGKAPWEYDDDLLVTLCRDCHKGKHDIKDGWGEV